MRSRQVSLPRLRWRTTPGSVEPGAKRAWAIACSAATCVQHRRPAVLAVVARAGVGAGRTGAMVATIWPAATAPPTSTGASSATTPAQGAVTAVSIFMALTTSRVSPAATVAPGLDRDLDHRAGHRAFDACLAVRAPSSDGRPVSAGWSTRRAAVRAPPPAARASASAPAAAGGAAWRGQLGMLGQQGGARIAGAHSSGRARMARSDAQVGRQAGDLELVQRARRAVERRGQRAGGVRLADHLGEHRIELRRRRQAEVAAGIDPHARAGRLLVGGDGPGARSPTTRACTA